MKFNSLPLAQTLLSATIALAWLGAAQAQTTLANAFGAALTYDAAYAAAQQNALVAGERIVQAQAGAGPTANISASGSRNFSEIYNSPADRQYWTSGVSLSGSYPIYRPALKQAVSQAELGAKLTEAALANAQIDLMVRVAQAYFDVLLAQDTLQSIAAQKRAIAETLAQAKREFEVGTKTIVDTNEAQARFDQVLAQEAVAKGDELGKRATLATLMGKEPQVLAQLDAKPTIPAANPADINAWVARAEQAAISVQSAQLTSEIAKLEIERNKLVQRPTADIVSSIGLNRSVGTASSAARTTAANASVGVQLGYSLFNGGALDSKVRESIAAYGKTLADVDGAKRAAAQSARQSYLSLTYGLAQINALESVRRSAQTLIDSTKLGYQVGVRINLDVLNAQQTQATNDTALAKARYDSIMAGLRLKAATSQLAAQDLSDISAQMK